MVVQVIKSHLTGEIIYSTDVIMACAFKLSLSSRKGYYRMSNNIVKQIIDISNLELLVLFNKMLEVVF